MSDIKLKLELDRLAVALGEAGQPQATLSVLGDVLATAVGYKLFTVLVYDRGAGGTKPVTGSDWSQQVLERGEIYVCHNRDDIRTAFFDYELIWSLGCESAVNLPVRWNGSVIGSLNLLHQSGWYDSADLRSLVPIAQLAIPAIQIMQGA
jgi:hypothetical protein